ncbi:MAG: triose-phosphate isomerase [Betaproteobacteria bacterium]
MRRPIIAGNWKMHKTLAEAKELVAQLRTLVPAGGGVEVVLCPPFTALATVAEGLRGTGWGLGAQDVFWEEKGAFTGEVSPGMLRDVGCSHVIVGHSERRQHFGETDETVARKVRAARRAGLVPIVCVGETLTQREAGETAAVVVEQVRGALASLELADPGQLIIAYEPVWAIGTGRNATPADANAVCAVIRKTVAELFGAEVANHLRIQYGGSVKPENSAELMRESEIDGALVGGASLDAAAFARIIAGAAAGR